MKVSWDDDIPNIWKVIKAMFQTTNQLLITPIQESPISLLRSSDPHLGKNQWIDLDKTTILGHIHRIRLQELEIPLRIKETYLRWS